jgi:hypothetical protein
MRRVAVMVLLSIAVANAADNKDKDRFSPGPASSYKGAQTLDKITIAAVPFVTDDETRPAFDKLNPNKYFVLPILVVMQNGTGKALRLDLRAEYITADGQHVRATPADDVIYLDAVQKVPKIYDPNVAGIPLPRKGVKKGPLNVWQIQGHAFNAKLLPPGEFASGFFYFQANYEPGTRIYLTGVKDAATGQDYFYYEVPLERQ